MQSANAMGFLFIFGTIFFTVYGQIVLKWRVVRYGFLPDDFGGKMAFLVQVVQDPWIISGLASALVASFFWIGAMTKFDLSYAYPFMSASFVLVFFISVWLFQEPMTFSKVTGLLLIISGIIVTSRSI